MVDRSDDAWLSLEFLAWAVNHDGGRSGRAAVVKPDARPPYLNGPGRTLRFELASYPQRAEDRDSADHWARWLEELRHSYFYDAAQAKEWYAEAEAGRRADGVATERGGGLL